MSGGSRACASRPRACPAEPAGCRARRRRPGRRLSRWACEEARRSGARRAAGLPLTINAVVHRQNLDQLDDMIALALELDAQDRGRPRPVLRLGAPQSRCIMPTREQLEAATAVVERARRELRGRLAIDYVIPDYWARRPKPCMGGWGSTILNVTPQGKVMPCHAAASIPGLEFVSVQERQLRWIWQESPAFQRFRGTVDARAVPVLRTQGGRLRWLPLPGIGAGRRCRGHRPRCELSPLRGDVHRGARRVGGRAAPVRPRRPRRDSPVSSPTLLAASPSAP